MTTFRFNRDNLTPEQRDISTWPAVDVTLLGPKTAERYTRRRTGVRTYLEGGSDAAIRSHHIAPRQVRKLLQRCLALHPDGRIWGERALIPHKRVKTYERRAVVHAQPREDARGGCSGALSQLFERFPELKEYVRALFLKHYMPDIVHESRIPVKAIHKRFLNKCRALGLKNSYPFTTKWLGTRGLGKHLAMLLREQRAIAARIGEEAARGLADDVEIEAMEVSRPYQRVQFDGHRIDAFFTILVRHAYAGDIPVTLPRIWLLVIKDVFSRAILGYCLAVSVEYSARDVLRCIRRAIVPWQRRTFTIPGLRYPVHGGFPSEVIPELQWAAWDEFFFDNAKANLADAPREVLTKAIGCAINAGPIKSPERRALIERFFKTLEENGFHRLRSTTGSGPDDGRRQNPEAEALKHGITFEHLEELVEALIADYNGTPHAGIGNRTPLEMLQFYVARGNRVRPVPVNHRSDVALYCDRVTRVVRGDLKKGKRPSIELEGVIYRNDVLSRSPNLIGKKLTLHVNGEDLRCVKAFLPDGAELGILTAYGAWGRTPHTLEMRRAINSLRRRKLIKFIEGDDPILVYHDYLAKEALVRKRARPAYAKAKAALPPPEAPAMRSRSARAAAQQPRTNVVNLKPRKTVTF